MAKWQKSSDELVEKFLSTMKKFNDIEPKKMFGYPCCFKNGHMFTGLHEQNWVLRLYEEDRQELSSMGAKPFAPSGRTMKQYVALPESLLSDDRELSKWIERSITFVSRLPPK